MAAKTWLWPIRRSPRVSGWIWLLTAGCERFVRNGRWVLAAVGIGTLPLVIGYWSPALPTQFLTGLLLAAILLPSAARDRFGMAAAVVALTIGSHSAVAIALSAADPVGAADALRGSSDYWRQTWQWVRFGDDQEYQGGTWLPMHLALLVAVPLTAYTSFGALPLARGVQELDLMNYYVGQLIRVSERPDLAVLLGWHPWSFVRGLAYTCLVFEFTSLSLERMTGRTLSTRRRRLTRLACGLGLGLLDMVAKVYLAPVIRQALYDNLRPEFVVESIP